MNATSSTANLSHAAIGARARRLWEAAGCPAGRDVEFWLRAERDIRADHDKLSAGTPPPLPTPPSPPPPAPQSPATEVPPVLRDAVRVSVKPPMPARQKRGTR